MKKPSLPAAAACLLLLGLLTACQNRARDERLDAGLAVLDLAVDSPNLRALGRPLDYRITVSNRGHETAPGVVLQTTIPPGNTFQGAANGGRRRGRSISWELGDLTPGEARTVTFTLAQVSRQSVVFNSQSARMWAQAQRGPAAGAPETVAAEAAADREEG